MSLDWSKLHVPLHSLSHLAQRAAYGLPTICTNFVSFLFSLTVKVRTRVTKQFLDPRLEAQSIGSIHIHSLTPSLSISHIHSMMIFENTTRSTKYLVYSTHSKVVGLVKFPIDGNPSRSMGLIAHSGEVTSIVCSHDGRYVFTAGGADFAVNQWVFRTDALDSVADATTGEPLSVCYSDRSILYGATRKDTIGCEHYNMILTRYLNLHCQCCVSKLHSLCPPCVMCVRVRD